MKFDSALKWLYDQLRKKRVSLCQAERKPNVTAGEIENIRNTIDLIEWIIEKVLEADDTDIESADDSDPL